MLELEDAEFDLISECFDEAKFTTTKLDDTSKYLKSVFASVAFPYSPEEKQSLGLSFYFGPNQFKTLKKYDLDLERQIPLGWGFLQYINIINRHRL